MSIENAVHLGLRILSRISRSCYKNGRLSLVNETKHIGFSKRN